MKTRAAPSTAPAASPGERLPFHTRYVDQAPESPGVYLLYRGHRLIYIGLAAAGATIRSRLRDHLRGLSARTRPATEFDYEASADAIDLYRHYLAVYLDASGGELPECNRTDAR